MTNVEFKEKLNEAFKSHILMKKRNYHTVNELLYVLDNDNCFNGEDFNISISTLDNRWLSIPVLSAFVDIGTRGIWFNDDTVDFEVDEFESEGEMIKINCITIYEREA
jgi:hypothetical protein